MATQSGLQTLRLMKRASRPLHILKGVSGVLQPGRLALLLGPPSSGKSTLLKALAGSLSSGNLQVPLIDHRCHASLHCMRPDEAQMHAALYKYLYCQC